MAKVEQMQLAVFLLYFSLPTHSQQSSYFHPVTEVHTRKAKDKLEKKKEKKRKVQWIKCRKTMQAQSPNREKNEMHNLRIGSGHEKLLTVGLFPSRALQVTVVVSWKQGSHRCFHGRVAAIVYPPL